MVESFLSDKQFFRLNENYFFATNQYSEEFESSASPIQRQFYSLLRVLPLKLSVDGVLVVTTFPTVFNILHLVVEA